MRFDEVTAVYGRFGEFLVGLTLDPVDIPNHFGLA
jgi:chlorite dismutase